MSIYGSGAQKNWKLSTCAYIPPPTPPVLFVATHNEKFFNRAVDLRQIVGETAPSDYTLTHHNGDIDALEAGNGCKARGISLNMNNLFFRHAGNAPSNVDSTSTSTPSAGITARAGMFSPARHAATA